MELPTTTTTKLTDLNFDCQVEIFRKLTVGDLLRVCDTSKQLRSVAQMVYSLKYGRQEICFNIRNNGEDEHFDDTRDNAYLNDLTFSLRLLRNFGHLIPKIELEQRPARKEHAKFNAYSDKIYDYIVKYSANNLKEIFLNGINENIVHFKTQFPKAEKVKISNCSFEVKITELKKCFPNMRSLVVYGSNIIDSSNLPLLEELSIEACKTGNHSTVESCDEVLRKNTHLRKLTLFRIFIARPLQSVVEHLPLLETLGISWTYRKVCKDLNSLKLASGSSGDHFHFKRVKELQLHFLQEYFSYIDRNPLTRIPLSFDQLEQVQFVMESTVNREIIEFLTRHPSIKKILICKYDETPLNEDEKVEIIQALPSVEDFYCTSEFSVNEILHMFNKCKLLKKFTCCLPAEESYIPRLEKLLNKQWKLSVLKKQFEVTKLHLEKKD